MKIDYTNIMEWAERYVYRELNAETLVRINQALNEDEALKKEWDDCVQFLIDLKNAGVHVQVKNNLKAAAASFTHPEPAVQPANRKVSIWKRYGRTGAIAAGLAILASTVTYKLATDTSDIKSKNEFISLKRDIQSIKRSQDAIRQSITESEKEAMGPEIEGNVVGTGFALTNDGYLATDYHVVDGADSIFIQAGGDYYKAFLVGFDQESDVAILKIESKNFKFGKGDIPYNLSKTNAVLAQQIFSLGYPQDDALYTEGYISSKKGLGGDEHSYQLDMPANPGQSGSPVFDKTGNIIGMVIGKKTYATYAIKSQSILNLVRSLPAEYKIKISETNHLKSLSRTDQVRKALDYVCAVRVYKN